MKVTFTNGYCLFVILCIFFIFLTRSKRRHPVIAQIMYRNSFWLKYYQIHCKSLFDQKQKKSNIHKRHLQIEIHVGANAYHGYHKNLKNVDFFFLVRRKFFNKYYLTASIIRIN